MYGVSGLCQRIVRAAGPVSTMRGVGAARGRHVDAKQLRRRNRRSSRAGAKQRLATGQARAAWP